MRIQREGDCSSVYACVPFLPPSRSLCLPPSPSASRFSLSLPRARSGPLCTCSWRVALFPAPCLPAVSFILSSTERSSCGPHRGEQHPRHANGWQRSTSRHEEQLESLPPTQRESAIFPAGGRLRTVSRPVSVIPAEQAVLAGAWACVPVRQLRVCVSC